MTDIQSALFEKSDTEYKKFQAPLIPTVHEELIIGVRTPVLRAFAKSIYGTKAAEDFIGALPHRYYDEDNLHAFLIEQIQDYDSCIKELDRFLPYVDNWATCDSMSPRVLKKQPERLIKDIVRWLSSSHTYTVRYGIVMLMKHFLDDNFTPEALDYVANISSDEYYINMARAWFFATALTKQYDSALPYVSEHRLDGWTRKKAIQKARESYRISKETKEKLKALI
ncbi:MAG: DNA alkylation repair protein [Clostridia bacterium]|nr:DNA alkylation repair protein [Clostridia bacterium]